MWQPCQHNLLSLSCSQSHTQARAQTVVDLIRCTAASGKVAPGLSHALSSWKQNNKGRQRDQRGDSWLIYHFSSKSTTKRFTVHTKEVVI